MIHTQAKTYGLPPHLLADCTWKELEFNQEVLTAGNELEARTLRRNQSPGRSGNPGFFNRLRRK